MNHKTSDFCLLGVNLQRCCILVSAQMFGPKQERRMEVGNREKCQCLENQMSKLDAMQENEKMISC